MSFFLNSFFDLCMYFKFRTPRSNFVLHHEEATGHKFYQSQQEADQSQYQQQPIPV
jgi:hypothetical protein